MPHHRRLPPSGPPNRSLKARTPARPDGANLKPPAPAAGGFTLGSGLRTAAGRPRLPAASRFGTGSNAHNVRRTGVVRGAPDVRGARTPSTSGAALKRRRLPTLWAFAGAPA